MCRCTIIALTEEQALKYGITADEDLPSYCRNNGWSTSPLTFGEMQSVVDTKIANSILDKEYLLSKQNVMAEWKASQKLSSLLSPMDDKSRDLFQTIADTVIPLDPTIRPSAVKTFLDYVQGNDAALTAYLKTSQSVWLKKCCIVGLKRTWHKLKRLPVTFQRRSLDLQH
jgi:hypothetical protein